MTHNEHVILGALKSGYITVDHIECNKKIIDTQLEGTE